MLLLGPTSILGYAMANLGESSMVSARHVQSVRGINEAASAGGATTKIQPVGGLAGVLSGTSSSASPSAFSAITPGAFPGVGSGQRQREVFSRWLRVDMDSDAEVAYLVKQCQPRYVIYAHAVCDVTKCEQSPDWARQVNVGNLMRLMGCLKPCTRLIYISSDHVFGEDGVYDETSPTCPISVYGRTRVEAEQHVLRRPGSLVIRTGLPLGRSYNGRTGHLDWLGYRLGRGLPVSLIVDESRQVVDAQEVAGKIIDLARSGMTGVVHLAGDCFLDRPTLARRLCDLLNWPCCFQLETRAQQKAPHLGRVHLVSRGAMGKLKVDPLSRIVSSGMIFPSRMKSSVMKIV